MATMERVYTELVEKFGSERVKKFRMKNTEEIKDIFKDEYKGIYYGVIDDDTLTMWNNKHCCILYLEEVEEIK